ncbi:MAG: cytochrome P450 [Pseudomonadota bacterium]
MPEAPYRPPGPRPIGPQLALFRAIWRGDRDLINLLPASAYEIDVGRLGHSRRGILLINDPATLREILTDPLDIFPKNDLMQGALAPLVGDSIFGSGGDTWRRQRRMIEPAFSHMRINRAFDAMRGAVDDLEQRLDAHVASGEPIPLTATMSQVTADIICRTIFSRPLDSGASREVFDAFDVFESSVANVSLRHLILSRPFSPIAQPPDVLAACERIRLAVGQLLDPKLDGTDAAADIAADLIAARDPEDGSAFDREELIDQLGVFFLAGHETTASALTWVLFILSQRPEVVARMRDEVAAVVGDEPVSFAASKQLPYVRNVFRETLRLYPPITFIPRVAAEDTRIAGKRVRRGTMLMVSPWTIQRHRRLWRDPDVFDPDRFLPAREADMPAGAYLPFGQGPRVCVGAAFAVIESALIIARLVRRYDFEALDAEQVRPVARLTTRPEQEVLLRIRHRSADDRAARPDGEAITQA